MELPYKYSLCDGFIADFIVLGLIKTNPINCNAVDLVLKDKLYTIIVDTMEIAISVLEENKKFNESVFNLLSLDFVDEFNNINDEDDIDVDWALSQLSNSRSSQIKKDCQLTSA